MPKPERRGKALEEKVSFYKRNVRENVGSKKKESEKGREKEIFIRRENGERLQSGSRADSSDRGRELDGVGGCTREHTWD